LENRNYIERCKMKEAQRISRLPIPLFPTLNAMRIKAEKAGLDIINLGIGNPDMPTARHIRDALHKAVENFSNHGYESSTRCLLPLREAMANWYKQKFNVTLDPEREVLPTIGSKEGLAHLATTYLDPDDIVLIPAPTYPAHFNGVIVAGGIPHYIELCKERDYLPDLDAIEPEIAKEAKIMILSYPNNPTGALVKPGFFEEVVEFARKYDIFVVHDLAYSEIVFNSARVPSFLEIEGAKEIGVEFHSLSKTYNMAGWRVGFALGNAEVITSLARVKSYIDFGIFRAIQMAGIAALTGPQNCVRETVEIYRGRRDVLVSGLRERGWEMDTPASTFYVWAPLPERYSSMTSLDFVSMLIEKTGVVISPGTGFGPLGEGYVRIALVAPEERLKEAVRRIGEIL